MAIDPVLEGLERRDPAALARAISLVENQRDDYERVLSHAHARVGVIAVDPTSPFTGGALLGDRIRMESASHDPGVFIRSMATRGAHGGLATTTEEVADLLEAFGFDRILIETAGVR